MTQAIDFYGDRSPEELAAYAVHRAARFVRLPASTLRLWAARDGEHYALFHPASQSPLMLSFSNLVEAFVLASMRRVFNVSMQKVRKAVRFVGRDLGVPRPLIHGSFRTDGVNLFVHHANRLLDISAKGQAVLRDFTRGCAKGI